MKVLVVDDDADLLDLMTYALRREGYSVLTARMKTVLRRCQADPFRQAVSEVKVGDLVLDLQSHEVTKGGAQVQLTPLEFRVLYLLAVNEGRVIPYSRLVEYAWGYYDEDNSSLLKTHICHIRKKLGVRPHEPCGIRVVQGVGYVLTREGAEPES